MPRTPTTRPYRTPRESPGYLLWQATLVWQRLQRDALEPLGLTHVQFVLLAGVVWLERDAEPVTQTLLAEHAKTDIMMTSQVARALEKKKLLRRAPHPTDSRSKILHATPEGRALARRAVQMVEETDRRFFRVLAGDERRFEAMLEAVVKSAAE